MLLAMDSLNLTRRGYIGLIPSPFEVQDPGILVRRPCLGLRDAASLRIALQGEMKTFSLPIGKEIGHTCAPISLAVQRARRCEDYRGGGRRSARLEVEVGIGPAIAKYA